jgi:hypothetical protein
MGVLQALRRPSPTSFLNSGNALPPSNSPVMAGFDQAGWLPQFRHAPLVAVGKAEAAAVPMAVETVVGCKREPDFPFAVLVL